MKALAVVVLRVVQLGIGGGYQHLVSSQSVRYALHAVAVNHHLEDASDNGSSFFIHNQVLFVLRVAAVAVGDAGGHALAVLHPGLENGLYLPAGIAGVKFVHNVQKRGEIVIPLLVAVDTIVDSDEAHTLVSEHDIGVKADLEIVPPEAAHVLDDDRCHVPGLHLGNHGLEALSVKGRAAHSIIGEVADIGKAIPLGIVLQKCLLIQNGVAGAL